MELEARVQALEQELQILKNQIQATLLDIQAQLLTNAYPSLRTEETQPTAAPSPIYQQIKPEPEIKVEEEQPEVISTAKVRKVSLDQVRGKQNAKSLPPTQQPEEQMDWDAVNEWEKWASSKVKEIGVSRTQTLIHMYAQNGRFTQQVADILLQVVSLYEEETIVPPQNGNSRPHLTPASQPQAAAPRQTVPTSKSQPVASVKSANTLKKQLAPKPQSVTVDAKPATPSKPQSAVKAKPAPRPQAVKSAQQTSGTQSKTKKITSVQPVVSQEKRTAPLDVVKTTEHEDESRTLILKLMAGIQNAGAGVKRGNKRG